LGSIASALNGKIPVIWNIQASIRQREAYKPMTALMVALGWGFSRLTHGIIFNSLNGKEGHEKIGYISRKNLFIPNGFDLDLFRPDEQSRKQVQEELAVPEHAPCIGLFARFHPVKAHHIFLEAAEKILNVQRKARFILCGEGCDERNELLGAWIHKFHLLNSVHLLGRRDDMPKVMAAMDLVVSCSLSEGFSNVIGEAMACEVPCVVTDVGDSSLIVGETGSVIPPNDPEALSEAVLKILDMSREERKNLGHKARIRIQDHFSIQAVVEKYETVYRASLGGAF
ncbi:MAG: glycosyltransferase, partial [Thermodesulfobacteriota bacterium]